MGRPSVKFQRKSEKSSPASRMSRKIRAPEIAASILAAERTIPASASRRALSASPNRATASGSNPAKAVRKASRLRSMVIQASPAWKPSSTSFSQRATGSRSGTPHSWS